MARITSKYQLTIPKAVAQEVGLKPGDDVVCEPAGEILRIRPRGGPTAEALPLSERLELFDRATERARQRASARQTKPASERDWTRDELYER